MSSINSNRHSLEHFFESLFFASICNKDSELLHSCLYILVPFEMDKFKDVTTTDITFFCQSAFFIHKCACQIKESCLKYMRD